MSLRLFIITSILTSEIGHRTKGLMLSRLTTETRDLRDYNGPATPHMPLPTCFVLSRLELIRGMRSSLRMVGYETELGGWLSG